MAWTNPTTQSTGTLITATIWNTDIVDNLTALRSGSLAITSQGANEIIYASSSSQLARSSSFTFNGSTLSAPAATFTGTLAWGGGSAISSSSNVALLNAAIANTSASASSFGSTAATSVVLTPGAVPTIGAGGTNTDFRMSAVGAGGILYFRTNGTDNMSLSNTGLLTVSGFGTHSFSAGGTGGNIIAVANPTAGTGNFAAIYMSSDTSNLLQMRANSSTLTPSGFHLADGIALEGGGVGGVSIAASHASGDVRIYSRNALAATFGASQAATFTGVVSLTSSLGALRQYEGADFWSVYHYTDQSWRLNYNDSGNDELILDTSGALSVLGAVTTGKYFAGARGSVTLVDDGGGVDQNVNIGDNSFVVLTGSAATSVGGFTGGVDGRILFVRAPDTLITFVEEDAGSTAANRIANITGTTPLLDQGALGIFIYDGNIQRWIAIKGN